MHFPAIQELRRHQASALLAFYRRLPPWVVHWFEPFPGDTAAKITAHLAAVESGTAISFGLLTAEERIAGHGFVLALDAAGPVFGIGLAPDRIGCGWGRKLMNAVIEEADRRGVPRLVLSVFRTNSRARSLYESFGFVSTGKCQCRQPDDSIAMERLRHAAAPMPRRSAASRRVLCPFPRREGRGKGDISSRAPRERPRGC